MPPVPENRRVINAGDYISSLRSVNTDILIDFRVFPTHRFPHDSGKIIVKALLRESETLDVSLSAPHAPEGEAFQVIPWRT
jgi:hypothetical protein